MAPRNVFLHPSKQLERQARPVARLLAELTHVLPASLQADTESHYACAENLSLKETQERLLERTGFVIVLARAVGFADIGLDERLVEQMHEGIFQPVFGGSTLGYRQPPKRSEHRDDDGVKFPYWVVSGPGRDPEISTRHGVRSGQVLRRVGEACERFERDAPAAVGDTELGAHVIAQLYVRLIRTHPFGDGNGRTAWAAVQFAAGRLRLPFVQSDPTTEARVALGDALRDGNRLAPLATEIRTAMWGRDEAGGRRGR